MIPLTSRRQSPASEASFNAAFPVIADSLRSPSRAASSIRALK
jgi:hypothetical protein